MTKEKIILPENNVGIVKTEYFSFNGITLESGEKFGPITLAYETYGKLNASKSNAVLILHALSGDAHAAGLHAEQNAIGWWDSMIGPGKAFDTNKYCVICSNVIGGCKGSTGPSSVNPKTNKPYALDFPLITIGDMVTAQKHLIESLGIEKLLTVVGGSMGGMQVLSWLVKYPRKVRSVIPIATAIKHSPQQIAFNEVGRQAIMADAYWKSGNYYEGPVPAKGLAVARMIGHITYMSDISMAEKFGRQKKNYAEPFKFTADFEVEGYLRYRGDNFVKRFDANSYLYITKAMDNFDASKGKPFYEVLKDVEAKALVVAFKSDWLYPAYQSKEIAKACKLSGIDATYCEIDSTYGHDAFLLEVAEETHLISHFLKKVVFEYEAKGRHDK
ncbi:MAG: homoserine O-acetyltransferase [Candidatus Omnitrophica bacterium]|nr:homoserine O-acetyltransferase [Candidatus Omnitrophota bacterium]MDD5552278.1 homoserine O-acetyltransferase [Candidatus Omnitrophota bacterium]